MNDETQDVQQPEEVVEVTYKSGSYKIPLTLAQELRQRDEEVMGLVNKALAAREAPEPVEQKSDAPSDPKEYAQWVADLVEKRVYSILEKQTIATKNQSEAEAFWNGFYSSNPKLKGYDPMVKAMLSKHFDTLKAHPDTQKAQAHLASLVKKELKSIAQSVDEDEIVGHSGLPGTPAQSARKPKEANPTTSLDILKKRRASKY